MERQFAQILVCLRDQPRGRSRTRAQSQQNKTDPGSGRRRKHRPINRVERELRSAEAPALGPGGCCFSSQAHPPQPASPCSPRLSRPEFPSQGLRTSAAGGGGSTGAAGPACCCFLLLKSCVTFRLGTFPVVRTRWVQVSPCSSFLQAPASEPPDPQRLR